MAEIQQSLTTDGGGETAPEPPLAPGEPRLPGPFPVGKWATGFRDFLRDRPRMKLIGEVVNLSTSARAVYFDLRDETGGVPCSIWRNELDRLDLPEGALKDGVELIVAGGPDYFPGSERSKPGFNFRVTYLRPAGEGDLLAQLDRLRRQLDSEGIFEPQKLLPRPVLPRTIGVVVGSNSAAYADILAALERRGWRGRLVLAHPPVQGKVAAPKISAAIRELAAIPEVETIIVSRGGGSLTDLWCFCDEHLCRTISALRVPVISAVGHEVDRTLIDDVAAVACSTPTHAADAAVQVDVNAARSQIRTAAGTLSRTGRRTVGERARRLSLAAQGIAGHMRRERSHLHQKLREIRAAAARGLAIRDTDLSTRVLVLGRRREASLHETAPGGSKRARLDALAGTLVAHDPQRVLERGYAMVSAADGGVVSDAAAARAAGSLSVRFSDDDVRVEVSEDG